MTHLVFLVEEPSMRSFLKELLPCVLPDKLSYDILAHEGKTDLEGSIPRKIRGYNLPGYEIQFVILWDQHGGDCIAMKRRLQQICEQAGRNDVLIRIVCSELESWYLGDLVAIETAFQMSNLSALQNNRSYRNPDQLTNAADLIYLKIYQECKYSIWCRVNWDCGCLVILTVDLFWIVVKLFITLLHLNYF